MSDFSEAGSDPFPGHNSGLPASPSAITLLSFVSTASAILRELELGDGLRLDLSILCNLIAAHPTLQQTEIISTESYATAGYLYSHRFLVLELRSLYGRVFYVRLDRRRSKQVGTARLLFKGGKGPANDHVRSPNSLVEFGLIFPSK